MNFTQQQIQDFQAHIFTWYGNNKRDLPWRKTRNPYYIFISEIMLQQTQVSRVIPKYEAWMQRFPTIESLATAPLLDVLQYWTGLGYNRRALNMQKAAQVLLKEYNGVWPKTVEALQRLPGIGVYTASAIACFAFNEQIAVVDTNVKKIIITQIAKTDGLSEREYLAIATNILPTGRAYEWNQALMDYSNLVLKKEKRVVPKQSKFKGSNRYYRGKIVKLLTERKSVVTLAVCEFLQKDIHFVETILSSLEKDGFIQRKGEIITFKD